MKSLILSNRHWKRRVLCSKIIRAKGHSRGVAGAVAAARAAAGAAAATTTTNPSINQPTVRCVWWGHTCLLVVLVVVHRRDGVEHLLVVVIHAQRVAALGQDNQKAYVGCSRLRWGRKARGRNRPQRHVNEGGCRVIGAMVDDK